MTTPEPELFKAVLGSDPSEIARVRAAMREIADREGFGERSGDLVLAIDEVVANAQEHGRAPVQIRAWNDGRLVVEVRDVGEGFDRAHVWQKHPPTPLGPRGRGLWIARQLADYVEVTVEPDGTVVRLEVSPDPHIGA